jgi:transcription elongation factor GreA-like protein
MKLKDGSTVRHKVFGNGRVKHFSNEKVIVDFGKFEITFDMAQANSELEII